MSGALRASGVAVLAAIRSAGRASRVEIAHATGLTQATVSTAVRDLIADGRVVETGERTPTRGKPRTLLELAPLATCAVGVQLGADAIVVCVTDAVGAVVARSRIRGARDEPPCDVIARVARTVRALGETTGLPDGAIVGAGVVSPGLLDLDRGVILRSRSLPRWVGIAVADEIGAAIGLPAALENDASAAALGEHWRSGSAVSPAHCTVHMGATVGIGILAGGELVRGASGNTGAIGPMPVRRGGSWLGTTVDDLATPRAVAERAYAHAARGTADGFEPSADRDWFHDFQQIATLAVHGSAFARSLIEGSADDLGDALVTVVNLLDLDSVSLAGPAFEIAGTIYLRQLSRRLAAEAFAGERHPVRVRLADQLSDAAAVGAAALALRNAIADPHPRR
ncbi:ROK family transcriptional regulator [Microbacterium indicum]|uniref:ROK family transcriptional regulator n=1 Tax=Microbacterium indicum TaxID=358100 RepID=UPI00042649A3|nr:ROK family transcriptional regulator [Microbacterium indicum]